MTQTTAKAENAGTLHQQALIELRSGQVRKGLALLEEALSLNPGSGDIHNDIATALWQTGDLEKAQMHFNKAIKLESTRPHIFNNYGYFLLTTGQPKIAERLLRKAIDLKPDFGEAVNNLGLCMQMLGKMEEAENAYISAIRLNPSWAQSHYNIGRFYLQTGALDRAELALERTIELAPKHFQAWFELAHVRQAKKNMDGCIACLEKALMINPRFEEAWLQTISLLTQLGEKEKADKVTKQALEFLPGHPAIITDCAIALRNQKKFQQALDMLETAQGPAKNSPFVLFEKARNHHALLQIDEAFAAFEKANEQCKANAVPLGPYLQLIRDNVNLFKNAWIKSWTPAPPLTIGISPTFVIRFPGSAHVTLPPEYLDRQNIEQTFGVPAIANVVNYLTEILGKDYPAGIAKLTEEQIQQARMIYMMSLQKAGIALTPGNILLDTSPLNILYAGLIHRLFPDSPFIVAQMHPYNEVLLSYMEQPAARETVVRTFDLMEAARLYGQSFRLWEHYRGILPLVVAERANPPSQNLWKAYQGHIYKIFPTLEPWAEKYGYELK